MKLRTILFWAHLATGVSAAIIVLLMSVTGVALTYQRQLTELATRDYRSDAASRGVEPLTVEALLARVGEQSPGFEASSVTFRVDPAEPALLTQGRRQRAYVDRYTGSILGDGSSRMTAFLQTMMSWHRWLGQEGEGRNVGRAITGACNLAFLFLVVSGIFLWWPRNWSPRSVRNVTWFRGGLQGKARDFNWHNVIGLWMFVPLLIVVASGVVISYRWAGDLVFAAFGEEPSGRDGPQRGGPPRAGRPAEDVPGLHKVAFTSAEEPRKSLALDELVAMAVSDAQDWKSLTVQLPESPSAPVRFSIDLSLGGQPAERSELELDRTTGKVVARRGHADLSPGQRARAWLRFAHTGEVYGVVGQTIAGLASAGAAVLVWTGLALTWRRFFRPSRS